MVGALPPPASLLLYPVIDLGRPASGHSSDALVRKVISYPPPYGSSAYLKPLADIVYRQILCCGWLRRDMACLSDWRRCSDLGCGPSFSVFDQNSFQLGDDPIGDSFNIFVGEGKRNCWHDCVLSLLMPHCISITVVDIRPMKTTDDFNDLPDDLHLVPAQTVRRAWHLSVATEWRMEQKGELQPIRLGRRKYYRLSDLRRFLEQAAKNPPIAVPWQK